MGCSHSDLANSDGGVTLLKWSHSDAIRRQCYDYDDDDDCHDSEENVLVDARGFSTYCSVSGLERCVRTRVEGNAGSGGQACDCAVAAASSVVGVVIAAGEAQCRANSNLCDRCRPLRQRQEFQQKQQQQQQQHRPATAAAAAAVASEAAHRAADAARSAWAAFRTMPPQIDLDEPHPVDPPYLGSSDWVPVTLKGGRSLGASCPSSFSLSRTSQSPSLSHDVGGETERRRSATGVAGQWRLHLLRVFDESSLTPTRKHLRGLSVTHRDAENPPCIPTRWADGTPPRNDDSQNLVQRKLSSSGSPSTRKGRRLGAIPPPPFSFTKPDIYAASSSPKGPCTVTPSPVVALVDGETPDGGLKHRRLSLYERLAMMTNAEGGLARPLNYDLGHLPSLLNVEATPPRGKKCFNGDGENDNNCDSMRKEIEAAHSSDTLLTSTTVSTDCHGMSENPGWGRSATPMWITQKCYSPSRTQKSAQDDDAAEANLAACISDAGVVNIPAVGELFAPRRLFDDVAFVISPQKSTQRTFMEGAEQEPRMPLPSSSPGSTRYVEEASKCTSFQTLVDRELCARDAANDWDHTHDVSTEVEIGGDGKLDNSLLDASLDINNVNDVCSVENREDSPILYKGILVKGHIPTPSSIRSLVTIPTVEDATHSSRDTSESLSRSGRDNGNESTRKREDYYHNVGNVGRTDGRTSGTRRMRHISTLPSLERNRPIRLRVTESYAGLFSPIPCVSGEKHHYDVDDNNDGNLSSRVEEGRTLSAADYSSQFSFDPFINSGRYTVTTPGGNVWGNGVTVEMSPGGYQTMLDRDGRLLAVIRSRHTYEPSHVVYSPKPRFVNQIPSSHRPPTLLNGGVAVPTAGRASGMGRRDDADPSVVLLYPWALVSKEGRTMDAPVSVRMVERGDTVHVAQGGGGITFSPVASYRCRHGFADGSGLHTHTVVTRVERRRPAPVAAARLAGGARTQRHGREDADESEETEVPCCLILRDPSDKDVFNLTIAPGIDPLLVICYLAAHARMDVEPILSDMSGGNYGRQNEDMLIY